MPDLSVDIGGLDALGKNLDRTTENISSATKRMEKAGPDSIGPEGLDQACSNFRADWKEGLDKLRDAVEKIKGSLDASKQCYVELDSAIAQDLEKMATGVAVATSGEPAGGQNTAGDA
ncbi:excreted virulence factor EspC (type VII ESX diderm) [Halopolyspora algeriensis]|uniref:Excreted virulence factor EspC (Type VII ESX diderm) n=1 Tax=Halopolyspora algeriensis TaxID=1500506 RepID=A0A368VNQ8_9ACTN|nr:type VII secretion target [Halopolyspora algeriensis]RCW43124.1 excreted virulence factor EspC (type VII ESX diderm) [Halopolyspora algeriensis]TQM56182.1 excreted virulence factor EspC (type VII ESX diderm) [Halopolyspora algeriensis]